MLKTTDGEEYSPSQFIMARVEGFQLVILMQLTHPPPQAVEHCYVIRVHTPQPALF